MTDPSPASPTVSVVIPTYNAADLLPDAVESVLAQTYRDFELIVVDDGSTDETPEVMERYADDVRYVRKENGGSASARNRGIREARGQYVALLDADDLWLPEKLEHQMEQFEAQQDLAWSYTDWVHVDAETGGPMYHGSQVMNYRGGNVLRPLLVRLFIPPSTEVIRRDVFEEVGTYDESELHRISEDWEFSLRVAERYPVGYVDRPLAKRRHHPEKKTTTMDLEHALKSRHSIIEKTVRRNPDRLADVYDSALANLYTRIGSKWLNREERARARKLFRTAIRHDPTFWRAWMYGVAAFLPRPILRVLGRLRAAFRRLFRSQLSPA